MRYGVAFPILLLFAAILTLSCDDIRTGTAFDRSVDFSSFNTYAWVGRKDPEINAQLHRTAINAIRAELASAGLATADLSPDLYVTYFSDQDEQVRVDIRRRGYTYGRDLYWSGLVPLTIGGSNAEIRTFEEGSLVVDIYSTESNQLIWRGVASATVSQQREKNENLVKRAVTKLFKEFPPRRTP